MEWNIILTLFIGGAITKFFDEISHFLKDKQEKIKIKRDKDIQLYNEFKNDLKSDSDIIYFLKEDTFGENIRNELLDELFYIQNKWEKLEYKYFNKDIEQLKNDFLFSLKKLNNIISKHTFSVCHDNTRKTVRIDKENKNISFDKKIKPIIDLLDKTATDTYNKYEKFILKSKELLYK